MSLVLKMNLRIVAVQRGLVVARQGLVVAEQEVAEQEVAERRVDSWMCTEVAV